MQLARRCAPNVALSTLAAIAKTESGFDPLLVNDNTTATRGVFASREKAVSVAGPLIAAGHSVDLGLMQINSATLLAMDMTVSEAFDACQSLRGGAAVLAGDYQGGVSHRDQQRALRRAISRYNTGDPAAGFSNGYVRKVELAARTVPALDVGASISGEAASAPHPATPASPVDPNAPPTWDVWASSGDSAAYSGGHPGLAPAEAAGASAPSFVTTATR